MASLQSLESLFASGRVVDLILCLMLLEFAVLLCWRRGPQPLALLGYLASGAALLLALRLSISGSAWYWIALALLVALVAHVVDLAGRWRAQGRG